MGLYQFFARRFIKSFEKRYRYDASYLHEVLASSTGAFKAFSRLDEPGQYRRALSPEAFFVSKIAAAQTEDCGPCTELNVRMAQECGVSDELLRQALSGEGLSPELSELRDFCMAVATNAVRPGQVERIRQVHGREALAELALSIASMRFYPCMKRALGYDQSCSTTPIQV